jgi:Carboxypeptidase regulatory-like domain/TonB dependent receptor
MHACEPTLDPGSRWQIGGNAMSRTLMGKTSNWTGSVNWSSVLALMFCAMVISGPMARAQILYGSITGTVSDASGAVIPNETVTVTNQATGDPRTTTTNSQGEYLVQDLEPAQYTVAVPAKDAFGGFTEKDVTVSVNREVRVSVMLKLKGIELETVVTDTLPILQTETAEVNHEISQTQIAELPISSSQGRNYQALYTLIPGAANVIEQNSTASNPSRAMSLNVNGVEDMSNTTRIDGAVNTYGWLPYLVAYVPPADSIQSVNIATNSFNAEQGVAGGASINVIIKSGTKQVHGSVWEYNQLFNTNARPYTATVQSGVLQVPKNIFNQFGFTIGGPVYIPKIVTGKNKLFFFQAFERTTRRQLITGVQTVPTTAMLNGDFSAVASGLTSGNTILYDPQPGGVGPYLAVGSRPTFQSEYGCNCIPASRQSPAAVKMLALLQPIAAIIGTPTPAQLASQLANDYNGSGTLAYNRNTSDSKVTYNATDRTSVFGRYSVEPFSVADPQQLGAAGGGTFDGGQPGAASGRIQNVGLGATHVITPRLLIDADAGYTRQVTGAQSSVDIADGAFGLNTLGIPGTNGPGVNYAGQPEFVFSNGFSSLGNSNGANPFLFRDNQFTADVNVSWTIGRHATKYGGTFYHFDLNHFQPTSGGGVSSPRGGFQFQGGLTSNSTSGLTAYNALADMLLGLPNNGTGIAVAKETQLTNPNSLRWSEYAAYAQDQWTITPKLTLNYGVRYELYPAPYRDHQGIFRLDPSLPQSANVEAGGINGNPQNAGMNVGKGLFAPRLGIAYRVNESMVIRAGGGITSDPDSQRFLRDEFPVDLSPTYGGTAAGTPAIDGNGNVMTLSTGIPPPVFPNFSSGFASLPVTGSTNTAPANYRRGYIESWNLFVQQDLGNKFVMNIGYVGTHQVRQLIGLGLNSAPLPSGTTECMANGQYNPSSVFYTHALGSNPCSFNANQTINQVNCPTLATGAVCYNTGGITMNEPLMSSNYNGLQSQLTRNAGRLAQFGLIYTWSHAFDFEDNGAGSGSGGLPITYPAYWALNRATSSYDRTNNVQFWAIYHLPFGSNQMFANHGIASAILGGFQLNGQISHTSGAPFSVSPSSTSTNSPGNTVYADLVAPYRQLGGHARTVGNSPVSGGIAWFDPASFANPVEPVYITSTTNPQNTNSLAPSAIVTPRFGNTHRNEFRGPGITSLNASIFRGFHLFRESEFQVRVEAFNLLNHAILSSNPTATVGNGTFGYITAFGATRSLQFSGRFNF